MNIPKIFTNKVSFTEKLIFTRHLSVMIKSGIPLVDALGALESQATSQPFKYFVKAVLKDISNGQSLEKALSKHPDVFSPTYISLIKIGEKSGNLEENLNYLSELLKKNYEFKKKIQSAMLYPILIVTTALIAGGIVSLFVLPQLVDLFNSLDVELPITTQILLFISNVMKYFGVFILGALVAFLIGFRLMIGLPSVKPTWHKVLLSLPVIGGFLQNIELSSLCRNIGIMLKSGLPISKAFQGQYEATTNEVYKRYIKQLLESIEKGRSLSKELSSGKYKFIPMMVIQIIGIGEKTGSLDESLIYLGDIYEEETDVMAKNLATTIEPVLLIIIGIFVAFMAMAIISPIYQITSGIKR